MSLAGFRYIAGAAKQGALNSGAATASTFPRWGNSTDINPDLKTMDIRQGDNTPSIGMVIKTVQGYRGKLVHQVARSIDVGFFLQAVFGSGSDAVTGTASGKTGTIASASAGATSLSYTLVGGTAPLANDVFSVDTGANLEWVTPSVVTGGGPYTLTVPATKFAHAGGVSIAGLSTHTFTPQPTRNYFTLFGQYQLGTPKAIKIVDAVFHSMTITGEAGKPLTIEYEFFGLTSTDTTASIGTVTYDASTTLPYVYYGGTFNVDGSTTGSVAPYVKKFKLVYKQPVSEEQTEAVTAADAISMAREVSIDYDILWQDFGQFEKVYYNAGTADSAITGTGSIDLTFFPGGDTTAKSSLELKASTLNYTAAKLPPPSVDGKPLTQTISAKAVTSSELSALLLNTQTAPF